MVAPTATSDIQIVNVALGRIGVSSFISSFTDQSGEAGAASNVYGMCRNQVLAAVDWPFARRRQVLPQLGGATWSAGTTYSVGQTVMYGVTAILANGMPLGGLVYYSLINANVGNQPNTSTNAWALLSRDDWGFVYSLPSDMVAPRKLITGVRVTSPMNEYPFAIESDPNLGQILCTDQIQAELAYTALISDPSQFSPGFVDALAWRLAVELTAALRKEPKVTQMASQAYELSVGRAISEAFNSQRQDLPPDADFILGR